MKRYCRSQTASWLRFATGLCSLSVGAGTVLASPVILWALAPIAALAAIFPVLAVLARVKEQRYFDVMTQTPSHSLGGSVISSLHFSA